MNTNNDKNRYLLKNIVLFTIGTFVPKVIVFVMVPLYTNYLTTEEYGTADLLTNTVALLMPILTVQVQDAVMKFSIIKEKDKDSVLNVGITITALGALLLGLALFVINAFDLLSLGIVNESFLFANFFLGALGNILTYYCRGIDKVRLITISSILNTSITVLCNILFLIWFNWGLNGYLLANTTGALIRVLYILLSDEIWKSIHLGLTDEKLFKDMLIFSMPMVFSAISWWINNASDKYILTLFKGTSIVGIYAVASKIPSILTAFGEVISKSFSISAIKEFDAEDKDCFLSNCYSNISSYMVLICSIVMIFNLFIAKILFSKDFYAAWLYCPPLLISIMFNQISYSCENILLAMNKTRTISITAIIGACTNTLLNFTLIPFFDAYGAAVATIIGFFIAWVIRYTIVRSHLKMHNNVKTEILSYLLILLQMIFAYWGNDFLVIEVAIFALLCFLFKGKINELKNMILYNLLRGRAR